MSNPLPMDAAGCVTAGRQRLQDGKIDDAIGLFEDALHMDPHIAAAAELLGVAYSRKGNFDEGVRYLKEAARLDPLSIDVRFNMAVALDRGGRTAEAISELEQAAQMDPANEKVGRALASLRARGPSGATSAGAFGQPAAPMGGQAMGQGVRTDLAGNPLPGQHAQSTMPPQTDLAGNPLPVQSQQAFPGAGGPPGQAPLPMPGQHRPLAPPPQGYQQQQQTPFPGTGAPLPPPGGPHGQAYGIQPTSYAPTPTGADPGKFSIEAVKRILSDPAGFGRDNLGWTDIGPAVVFLLIISAINFGFGALQGVILMATSTGAAAGSSSALGGRNPFAVAGLTGATGTAGILLTLVLSIPIAIAGEFIAAGIMHLFVMMFGGRRGYGATFRAMVCASVPGAVAAPLGLLTALSPALAPVQLLVGAVVGIWSLVVLIILLREMHGISTGGAVGAVLVPVILCGVLVGAIMVAGVAMVMSRGGLGSRTSPTFGSGPNGSISSPMNVPGGNFRVRGRSNF